MNVGPFYYYYSTGELQKTLTYASDGSNKIVSDVIEYYTDGSTKWIEQINGDYIEYHHNKNIRAKKDKNNYIEFDLDGNIVRLVGPNYEISLREGNTVDTYLTTYLKKWIEEITK